MSATEEQKIRSQQYGIAVKQDGHVTKPGEWASVPDDEFLDPVNYHYPCPNADQVAAAARYWGKPANQAQYSTEERSLLNKRLAQFERKFKIGDYAKNSATTEMSDQNPQYGDQEETPWVPVFRAGKYPQGTYTEQDLDGMIARYDPIGAHEAPLSFDHEHSGPAQGWVSQLKRDGRILYAKFRQVAEDFRTKLRDGRYKKPSVEIHPNYEGTGQPYLYAVTFLGANPPQVKGLPPANFWGAQTQTQTITIPFQEENEMSEENVMARQLAEKDAELNRFREEQKKQDALVQARDIEIKRLQEEQKLRDQQIARFREETDRQEIVNFLDGQIRDGKAIPAWRDAGIIEFLQSLESSGHERLAKFAEQGKIGQPVSQRDWFRRFLQSLPNVVTFGEIATKRNAANGTGGSTDPGQRLHELTVRKMQEHRDLNYTQAFNEVQMENRTLTHQYQETCQQRVN